jgi:hypothetical protein
MNMQAQLLFGNLDVHDPSSCQLCIMLITSFVGQSFGLCSKVMVVGFLSFAIGPYMPRLSSVSEGSEQLLLLCRFSKFPNFGSLDTISFVLVIDVWNGTYDIKY